MFSRAHPRFPALLMTMLVVSLCLSACGDNATQSPSPGAPGPSAAQAPAPAAPDPSTLTADVTRSPTFESGEGWGPQYAEAAKKKPGVVVGPGGEAPNVFAQQFRAQPGEAFKVVARASSVDGPSAMGRLQINWHGADDKFISTSITPIEVAQTEKSFESVVVAPEGATTGFLYVAPHGATDVVRYTEMRLLGKPGREAASN